MNITNRLFTYPVLSDEKDDYKESFFSVDYEQSMQGVNSLRSVWHGITDVGTDKGSGSGLCR